MPPDHFLSRSLEAIFATLFLLECSHHGVHAQKLLLKQWLLPWRPVHNFEYGKEFWVFEEVTWEISWVLPMEWMLWSVYLSLKYIWASSLESLVSIFEPQVGLFEPQVSAFGPKIGPYTLQLVHFSLMLALMEALMHLHTKRDCCNFWLHVSIWYGWALISK